MIRRLHLLALSLSLVSFGAFAQPPQEVPPPLPDHAGDIEAIPADADSGAPQPEILAQPVAEPLPATVVPEDKSVKGVTLNPAVGVYPIGYDSINVTGDNSGRGFFGLKPNVSLSTSFKTSKGQDISLDLSYTGLWREYYNKDLTSRDFENAVDGDFGIAWNDRISTSFYGLFYIFFQQGDDTSGDNAFLMDAAPTMTIKAIDKLSFKVGMWNRFLQLTSVPLNWYDMNSTTSPPTDLDEFARGLPYSDATYIDNFASGPTEDLWMAHMAANVGLTYKPTKGTTIGLDYKYIFVTYSNDDRAIWTGHLVTPSIKQNLPWKGGSMSLKDELRLRIYNYAVTPDGYTVHKYRNRLTIGINQVINDYMTFELFYRLQLRGDNGDSYDEIHPDNWGYMGVSFAF